MVGVDVFPIDIVPFLGDTLVFGGVRNVFKESSQIQLPCTFFCRVVDHDGLGLYLLPSSKYLLRRCFRYVFVWDVVGGVQIIPHKVWRSLRLDYFGKDEMMNMDPLQTGGSVPGLAWCIYLGGGM